MIEVNGIAKHYGRRQVLDDITFALTPGRVTGFVGPNGAGKSTTMRIMVGLTRPDRGEVRYRGQRFDELRYPARVIGAVLDARSTHPGRSARNHLLAAAKLSRIPTSRVDEVLDEVGLTTAARQRTGGFSLGMRQRLAVATALLGQPDVLVLDEPFNGLDPDGIRWLRGYLTGFAAAGGTAFVSSHLIAELAMFADDLVVIGAGKLLAVDTVDAITAARGNRSVVTETSQPAELVDLLRCRGLTTEVHGNKLVVHGTDRHHIAQLAFDARIRLDELTETTSTLEDAFAELTRNSTEFAAA